MTVDEMQTELGAMLDPLDIPGVWTLRERDAYETRRRVLDARIREATNATVNLADVAPQINTLTRWRDFLVTLQPTLLDRLAECPERPQTRADEYERLGLQISIRCIDDGFDFANSTYPPDLPLFTAMTDAGYRAPMHEPWNVWAGGYGTLPTVERRLEVLQKQRDLAQRHLDRALRDEAPAPL